MRLEWKSDLGEMKADIGEMKAELHAREARLIKWIAGLVAAGGGRRGWRCDCRQPGFGRWRRRLMGARARRDTSERVPSHWATGTTSVFRSGRGDECGGMGGR